MKRSPEDFEKLIHRALRDLPDRRAPRTLEIRVLAEIARRAELPWWRQSYLHWPAAMRGAFFFLSATAAAVIVAGLFHLGRSPESAQLAGSVWQHFGWLVLLRSLCADGWGAAADIYHALPPLWLYGTLAALAACYAMLIGIGAAAYRAFFKPTWVHRNFPS